MSKFSRALELLPSGRGEVGEWMLPERAALQHGPFHGRSVQKSEAFTGTGAIRLPRRSAQASMKDL